MIWGLWAESPKRVSGSVQTLFHNEGTLKQGFALCKRLLGDSHAGGTKTPLAPSFSTVELALFGAILI